jgi:hypothetical protein
LLLREMSGEQRVELLLAGVRVALPRRVRAEPGGGEAGDASESSSPTTQPDSSGAGAGPGATGPQPSLELAMRYA